MLQRLMGVGMTLSVVSVLMLGAGCGGTENPGEDGGNPQPDESPQPDEGNPQPDEVTPPPDEVTPPPDKVTPPPDEVTPPPDGGPAAAISNGKIVHHPINAISDAELGNPEALSAITMEVFSLPEVFGGDQMPLADATCAISSCSGLLCDYSCTNILVDQVQDYLLGIGYPDEGTTVWAPLLCGFAEPPDLATAAKTGVPITEHNNQFMMTFDMIDKLAGLINTVRGGQPITGEELLARGFVAGQLYSKIAPKASSRFNPLGDREPTPNATYTLTDGDGNVVDLGLDVYYVSDDLTALNTTSTGTTGLFVVVPREATTSLIEFGANVATTDASFTFPGDFAATIPGLAVTTALQANE